MEESKQKAEIAELTKLVNDQKASLTKGAARAAPAQKLKKRIAPGSAEKRSLPNPAARRGRPQENRGRRREARSERSALRKRTQRLAQKKTSEAETARISAENKRLLADQANIEAAIAPPPAHLPEPGIDSTARPGTAVAATRPLVLKADKPLVLDESDLVAGTEPTENNYNADYVPARIREMQKKYVMPEVLRPIVAETIEEAPTFAPMKEPPARIQAPRSRRRNRPRRPRLSESCACPVACRRVGRLFAPHASHIVLVRRSWTSTTAILNRRSVVSTEQCWLISPRPGACLATHGRSWNSSRRTAVA